jgi:hypothetical protein
MNEGQKPRVAYAKPQLEQHYGWKQITAGISIPISTNFFDPESEGEE